MKILGLRMRSGEDVIFKVTEETDNGFIMNRPLVPITRPETSADGRPIPGGREMLHFIKWMPFALEDDFEVTTEDFIGKPYTVPGEIENAYLEITSSISIAQPGQLNG